MAWLKKGWWKIHPRGKGNAANAFALMDELFQPTAHEAHLVLEEESRRIVKDENSDGDNEIIIKLKKKPESN